MKKLIFSATIVPLICFGQDINLKDKNDSEYYQIYVDEASDYISNIKLHFNDDFKGKGIKLLAHNSNYIFPIGYDTINHKDDRKHTEAKFQISIKLPLYQNFLNTKGNLYGGYTQNSYWQIFDLDKSSPFRETNHKPELFLDWDFNKNIFYDIRLKKIRFSMVHQSNGQDIPKSRSWNYNKFMVIFKKNNFDFGTDIFYRWKESKKEKIDDTEGDDNPDLNDYIGTQKIFIKYNYGDFTTNITHQNKFHKYNIHKGNTNIEFAFPSFNKNFRFIVQYFNGYGESLIDYNERVNKISFGVSLTN